MNKELQDDYLKHDTLLLKLRTLSARSHEITAELDLVKFAYNFVLNTLPELSTENEISQFDSLIESVDSVHTLIKLYSHTNELIEKHLKENKENIIKNKEKTKFFKKPSTIVNANTSNSKTPKNSKLAILKKNYKINPEINIKKSMMNKNLKIKTDDVSKTLSREINLINFLKESLLMDFLHSEQYIEKKEKQINILKSELNLHFHKLLIEGHDTRESGLTWILQSIWNIGCEVIISYLPDYLDEIGINFMFVYSHKNIELSRIKDLLIEIKSRIKEHNSIKIRNKWKAKKFDRNQVKFFNLFVYIIYYYYQFYSISLFRYCNVKRKF